MTLRIREAAQTVGLSADTLRYYEKISLVPRPARGTGAPTPRRIWRGCGS